MNPISSYFNKPYASVSGNASDSLFARNLVKNDLLEKVEANGDMQDMLEHISCNEEVLPVTLDYAGLAITNSNNTIIKMITCSKYHNNYSDLSISPFIQTPDTGDIQAH
ncbi:hypothetical protein BJV82DRAFT_576604 [Fennellomyces sp. T-0311]|nr:hypothetical protein BJV82DRAFT_576604 [Fennellomyces sp. T-0311]